MISNVHIVNTKVVVADLSYMFDIEKIFYLKLSRVSNMCLKFTYFETQFFEFFEQSRMEVHPIPKL
jgi:hypothetical protein